MTTIHPILLCGGAGTRLWPLSRSSFPKQFSPLTGPESLFQACVKRLSGNSADGIHFANPMTVTNSDFRFIVTEQMLAVGVDPGAILIEPEARNTGPAIIAAALHAHAADPDAILLVAPSDHLIPDAEAFRAAVARGLDGVRKGQLVTFGIRPDRAETGYGYLRVDEVPDGGIQPLSGFIEKPDAAKAERIAADGRHLWNAGIFLFAARDILSAFETHAPDMTAQVTEALAQARPDLGFLRLDPAAWARLAPLSIDYAVMEKAENLAVVPYDGAWSDMGSWDAVLRECVEGETGLATSGPVTALDCRDSLLRAEAPDQQVVGLGLRDLIVIAMRDAVLVADRSRAQEVGEVVKTLRRTGVRQADAFSMDHRPWGHFETLALDDRFQVKRIIVKPGGVLSLQSHVHRAEHWIVVAGTAKVTIGSEVRLVSENQSVYIPLGEKHRLENPGRLPMVLIEVQTGPYLGEDDITRYEDVYSRGEGPRG